MAKHLAENDIDRNHYIPINVVHHNRPQIIPETTLDKILNNGGKIPDKGSIFMKLLFGRKLFR
jgi:hypothetical protein